jgi:surface antigen
VRVPGERTLTSLRPVPNPDTRRPFAHTQAVALETTVRQLVDRWSGGAGSPSGAVTSPAHYLTTVRLCQVR